MSLKNRKKSRKRKPLCCNQPNLPQPAPFKDVESSRIFVRKIMFKDCHKELFPKNHIMSRVEVDEGGAKKLARAILNEDVGVNFKSLQPWNVELNLKPFMSVLLKFLKRNRKLSVYTHVGMISLQRFHISADKYKTPPKMVFRLLNFIIQHVIPVEMFGSKKNWMLFMSSVKRIINGSLSQTISISSVMRGFRVSEVPWLVSDVPSNCIRLNFLSCTVKWFITWTQYIISRSWYVTVSSPKQGVVFYKKPLWLKLRRDCMKGMILKKNLTLVAENNDIIACSNLRFLAKSSGCGLRPISLIKIPENKIHKTVLTDARSLLVQIVNNFGGINTPFRGGVGEVLQQQLQTIQHIYPDASMRPQYYFVRVDIKDAFGSINLSKMTSIFDEAVKLCIPDCNKVETVHFYRVSGPYKKKLLMKYFQTDKLLLKKCANWTETDRKETVSLVPLLSTVRKVINGLGVKDGGSYYQTTHGLPQGMELSVMLCELYYTWLDRNHLKSFFECQPDELYARFCDDYLFLTPNRERAKRFLNIMEAGFPDFSCEINLEKTLTNLYEPKGLRIPFVGFLINLQQFNVEGNYDNYRGVNVCHTISLRNCKTPGRTLKNRMVIIPKMSPILFDKRINSKHTALLNVYHIGLLVAFRFHAFVQVSFPNDKMNQKFFKSCILIGVRHLTRYTRSYLSKMSSAKWITANEVRWIGFQAFIARLGAVAAHYKILLPWLRWRLKKLTRSFDRYQMKLLTAVSIPTLPGPFATMR